MSFRDLKENKQKLLEKLANQLKDSNETDERFWYPATDKSGNGLAVIRFLPQIDGEDTPMIKIFSRSFQGPTGKWYINNDLGTLGQDDPVNNLNKKLVGGLQWEQVPEKTKEVVRKQKRKESYISNIYVVKDSINPEHEGKVFLFRYGKKFRSMIEEKLNPTFEGEERVNPFDMWEGSNLKIKIKTVDKYRNYNDSTWETPGPLFKTAKGQPDEKKLEEVYTQCFPIAPFIAEDQFKTFEELERKLNDVLGNSSSKIIEDEETEEPSEGKTKSKPKISTSKSKEDDDEIDENFFNNIDLTEEE